MTLRVEGLQQVVSALADLGADSADLRAFDTIGGGIVRQAQQLVERDTGALSSTIRVESARQNELTVIAGSTQVDYAGVINYTGSGFLTSPANNDTAGKIEQLVRELQELINRAGLR